MSTFEYILLEGDTQARIQPHSSEENAADQAWKEICQIERRTQRQVRLERELRRRKRKGKFLVGLTIVLAGTAIIWGTRARKSGERTVNRGFQSAIRVKQKEHIYDTSGKLLVLVNKDHVLPAEYEVKLHWLQNRSCAVAEEMYGALQDMLTDGSVEGREFVIASGYRDAEYQQRLLEEDIVASMESEGLTWQEAYEKETRETMPPGYSEHETGLAVDIVALNYQILDELQEQTPENRWLQEHCSEYGFILRYPKGKEVITGIDYEPWHFRYVGRVAAEEMMERGITLEEYLGGA